MLLDGVVTDESRERTYEREGRELEIVAVVETKANGDVAYDSLPPAFHEPEVFDLVGEAFKTVTALRASGITLERDGLRLRIEPLGGNRGCASWWCCGARRCRAALRATHAFRTEGLRARCGRSHQGRDRGPTGALAAHGEDASSQRLSAPRRRQSRGAHARALGHARTAFDADRLGRLSTIDAVGRRRGDAIRCTARRRN